MMQNHLLVTSVGEFTLGDTNVSSLRCNDTTISSLSDARDKTDVVDNPYGLDFVNTLQPRQFKWQTRNGNIKDGKTRLGFIAQELLTATDGQNDILDLVMDNNPEKLEAKMGNLVPILTQAIKELSAKVEALQTEVNLLKGK
jgi:trimeric autotransporter adhesin